MEASASWRFWPPIYVNSLVYRDTPPLPLPPKKLRVAVAQEGMEFLAAYINSLKRADKGTQFTCFTGTKVQILTQHAGVAWSNVSWFTGTKKYLRYWYKSANTDADCGRRTKSRPSRPD
jgi:hypothetical protein